MNKKAFAALTVAVLFSALLFVFAGCSSSGGGRVDSDETAVILGGVTYNNEGTVSTYVGSSAASNSTISNLTTKVLRFPDESEYQYQVTSGSFKINDYFFSTYQASLGSINDPYSETIQRQLFVSQAYNSALNADKFKITLGDSSKEVKMEQVAYLPTINETDLSTNSASGYINVVSGDVLVLSNQTNVNYRYLCRIYDTPYSNGSGCERGWTSADIRGIDWTDTDALYNYFAYSLATPSGGTVQFKLPAGVLHSGVNNLTVIINVYDLSTAESDTDGDFKTLVIPQTYLKTTLSGN